ncbi:MAG TPA: GntR family transcriptional regulator [Firmicutes bacterium]|jgi:GntR family transcriptional regulator|uniref:Putative transcriptional regulator (GntR family) n=1 Tax=anaerobic digester metagenome TaxID=1263854 RepID=A0A485M4M8_9ZZZZ|nr:GntR family transcriptional regulator [Bacillota bacterium]
MDFDAARPIYLQIVELHKRALMTGELKTGDKILSQRNFAEQYKVNPNTVQRAYREMEALGLVETLRGQGTFVTVTKKQLRTMKDETADHALHSFICEMKTLGFTLTEVLTQVQETWEKEASER